jgi:hypothetical protein
MVAAFSLDIALIQEIAMPSQIGGKARRSWFSAFAKMIADWAGRPVTFVGAAGIIVLWAAMGPVFGYSDTAHHQHLNDDHNIPDGVCYSELSKSRR